MHVNPLGSVLEWSGVGYRERVSLPMMKKPISFAVV
jgi:hypothetical protein